MSQGLKLILSSVIAFSRKKVCYNFSPSPHDGFSWDKVQIVSNLCSYRSKSCNFKVFMYKYPFYTKNHKYSKKWKKLLQNNQFLPYQKLHCESVILKMKMRLFQMAVILAQFIELGRFSFKICRILPA